MEELYKKLVCGLEANIEVSCLYCDYEETPNYFNGMYTRQQIFTLVFTVPVILFKSSAIKYNYTRQENPYRKNFKRRYSSYLAECEYYGEQPNLKEFEAYENEKIKDWNDNQDRLVSRNIRSNYCEHGFFSDNEYIEKEFTVRFTDIQDFENKFKEIVLSESKIR